VTDHARPSSTSPTAGSVKATLQPDETPMPRQSPAPGGVTLHDVARAAGVSLATASRVLNGSARRVADSYRERVEAAARRLGYTANLSAQATARGTSAIIALLVADIADPYFGLIAAGVARGADEAGLVLTIAITERDPEREASLVRTLRGQRPRGLILAASRAVAAESSVGAEEPSQPELLRELDAYASFGGRVVAIGRGAPELRSIPIDNFGGARNLGLAMAGRGYRRAVVLAAGVGVISSDDRVSGFAAAARASRSTGAGSPGRRAGRPCATRWPPALSPAPWSSGSATWWRSARCRPYARPAGEWATTSPSAASTTSPPAAT
jgi:hypothetical protein